MSLDEGFIKRLRGELRRFNVVGDTTWLKGKMVKNILKMMNTWLILIAGEKISEGKLQCLEYRQYGYL